MSNHRISLINDNHQIKIIEYGLPVVPF